MLAAFIAACWAAKGVPLRDPRKPSDPELFHDKTLPFISQMVTIVLLKDGCTYAMPWGTCLRSFFLKVFFLPFFSGAAGAPAAAAAGLAIKVSFQLPVVSCQFCRSRSRFYWQLATGSRQLVLCFRRRFLLLGDRSLARTLAGAGVGMGALAADRQ